MKTISFLIFFCVLLISCGKNNNRDSNSTNPNTSNPLIALVSPHELVFTSSINNNIHAVNANDGSIKWTVNLSSSYTSSATLTPTLSNGVLYVGFAADSLAALNAQTGQILWRINIPNLFASSQACPLVYNNILYIGGGRFFYAINTSNGSIKWQYSNQPADMGNSFSQNSPTYNNGRVYINCTGGFNEGLYCFDALTGVSCGRFLPTNAYASNSSPCVVNNNIFALFYTNISSPYGAYVKLDLINNFYQVPGGYAAPQTYFSSPTFYNNILFYGSDSSLFAINDTIGIPSNILKWKFKGSSFMGSSSPTVYNNLAYIGSEDAIIYCIDVLNGIKKWEFKTRTFGSLIGPQTSPTVGDNILYYASANGLFALNANTGQMIWRCNISYSFRSPCVLSKTGEVFQSGLSGLKN